MNVHLDINAKDNEIMLVDTVWVYKKYIEFSDRFFGGDMPDIEVKVGRSLKQWGYARCMINYYDGKVYADRFTITISNAYNSPEHIKENVLLHEMIHIYDYYHFPYHFSTIVKGGLVTNRMYDAHGPEVFLRMASIINKSGYNITKYIGENEESVSNLTDDAMKRLSKPFCLCYAEYMKAEQENLMFLTSMETLHKIIKRYKTPDWEKFAPMSITVYYVSSPEMRQKYPVNRVDTIRGYPFSMDEWFSLLQHLKIENETPKIIYFNNTDMNENRIIKLTESDIRVIIKETLNELMNSDEPIDGGNAVGVKSSPTSIQFSIV